MASLRILARSKLSSIFHACRQTESPRTLSPVIHEAQKRWSSYQSSDKYTDPSKYTNFEITSDPNEWKYVERLLPYKIVPVPPKNAEATASGWKSQDAPNTNLPYFVPRSKNYMHPVYLILSKRGMRKLTYIRKIQGDIWKLESELKEYIQYHKKKNLVSSRISELAGVVVFRGDHVSLVNKWLESKGF